MLYVALAKRLQPNPPGLHRGTHTGADARLSWTDEDGDEITVVDDADLAEAVSVAAQASRPVRIDVTATAVGAA